jgi:hypothetical protein
MIKYVITKNKEIIVFPTSLKHSDFEEFNPISAGFISIGVNEDNNLTFSCYGESLSLGLKSNPKEDTEIAKRQLYMED